MARQRFAVACWEHGEPLQAGCLRSPAGRTPPARVARLGHVMQGLVTTPLGTMGAAFDEFGRLTELVWLDDSFESVTSRRVDDATARLQIALDAYFSGEPSVPLVEAAPRGTEFQKSVWSAVSAIPWGTTETYGAIARRLGNPAASRAVGMANAKNPIAIFIPCHRLLGSDGDLRGYAGGINRKQSLLILEASG